MATVILATVVFSVAASAGESGWFRSVESVSGRRVATARPSAQRPGAVLTVIIEGDGAAFDSWGRPTSDPTPPNPLGYRIAQAWPEGPVAWVGRLCQFVQDVRCRASDWSEARFSAEAVLVTSAAIDRLKAEAGASEVNLVGWSGGGVMAVLVAQSRDDVSGLVTFAAPLDLRRWEQWRRLAPLTGSLNPSDRAFAGPPPRQVHLFGAFDPVVPPGAALAAARRFGGAEAVIAERPERHDCCWIRHVAGAARALDRRP